MHFYLRLLKACLMVRWEFFMRLLQVLIAGLAVGKVTEYYTGTGTKPVKSIVDPI